MPSLKSLLLLSVFTFSSSILATPPACLLAAVNTEPNPANLDTVCGSDAQKVQQAIFSKCGSNNDVAQSDFVATCSSAGKSVASFTAPSTSSTSGPSGIFVYTTASFDPSCSCTRTYVTSATGSSPTATGLNTGATRTGSSSSATGAAATLAPGVVMGGKGCVGSFAAAVVAVAGVVAVL